MEPKKWKKFFIAFLILIGLLLISGVILFKHYYNLLDVQLKESSIEFSQNEVAQSDLQESRSEQQKEGKEDFFAGKNISEKAFNIMVVGVDSREVDFEGRTDAMILVHVNPETKKIVTTSFLRDMYVDIPGHGGNRLNAAYVFGGPDLLLGSIKENFGIEIDHYVTLNFWLAIDIFDDLGGVDIEITELFFARPFWKKMQNFLENSASPNWRKLQRYRSVIFYRPGTSAGIVNCYKV